MRTFHFKTVPFILCEQGCCDTLGNIVKAEYGAQSVLLISDEGIKSVGILAQIEQALAAADLTVHIYTGVTPDPSEAVVHEAAALAKQVSADMVIGLGGGSSLDVAKLVAVLAQSSQKLMNIYGIDQVAEPRKTPLVLIPTTSGTGSEVTPISIITTGETTKMGVVSPQLYADMAVLDAKLTVGLPPSITAYTGIDAMVHAIEAYTSKIKKNYLSDSLAKQALTLLSENLLPVLNGGENLDAREGMLIGSMLAGQAFANAPVAAVHALAYPIGGIFHIPHGLSNALVLPHVLRFNAKVAEREYAELAPIFVHDLAPTSEQQVKQFIDAVEHLIEQSKIPARLRDVGIKEQDIETLAESAMEQTRLLVNNPREVSLKDAADIYRAAF